MEFLSFASKVNDYKKKFSLAFSFSFVKSAVDESPTTWKMTIDIGSADELHLKVVKRTTFLLFYALPSLMGLFLRGGLL